MISFFIHCVYHPIVTASSSIFDLTVTRNMTVGTSEADSAHSTGVKPRVLLSMFFSKS